MAIQPAFIDTTCPVVLLLDSSSFKYIFIYSFDVENVNTEQISTFSPISIFRTACSIFRTVCSIISICISTLPTQHTTFM